MNVLLVDDAPDVLELAQIGLEMAGWTCLGVSDGAAALEAVSSQSFDLLVLDNELGAESGLDLLPRLRAKTDAPAVFLTATQKIQQFLDAGARGVVAKPFDPLGLAAELERVLQV